MNRLIYTMLVVVVILGITVQCNQSSSSPEREAIQFNFIFQNEGVAETMLASPSLQKSLLESALEKTLAIETFDMVRIMVIDLSAYESWSEFIASESGQEYSQHYYAWEGDPGNWWEWKKFWQDYATIVSDQTLEIQEYEAIGTVSGVIGYNEFVAGVFQDGRVRYWYTGSGWGEEGETHDVTLRFASEVE